MKHLGLKKIKLFMFNKITQYKETKHCIIFINKFNFIYIIFINDRKFFKKEIKLNDNDIIIDIIDLKYILIIKWKDRNIKVINFTYKNNFYKNIIEIDNIKGLYEFNNYIIILNNDYYKFYKKKIFKEIILKEDDISQRISSINVFSNYLLIQFNFQKNLIFKKKTLELFIIDEIKHDNILSFYEYENYLTYEINNNENFVSFEKKTLKKFTFQNLNLIINKFFEYKNYIYFEIENNFNFLSKHDFKKINFNLGENMNVIHIREHKNLIKLYINLLEFIFYSKENLKKIKFMNLRPNDKITKFQEYNNYLKININDISIDILYVNIINHQNIIPLKNLPIKDFKLITKLKDIYIVKTQNYYQFLESKNLKLVKLPGLKRTEKVIKLEIQQYFLKINTNIKKFDTIYNFRRFQKFKKFILNFF